jgi:hypothetical protein
MDVPITLNLNRFVERSSAVFGKSGTGKTFLSRLLLAGVIQNDVAVNLVFDMHNQYGWEGTAEHASKVKGLMLFFPGQGAWFTLEAQSSRGRGSNPDFTVQVGFDAIEPEDVEMLAGVMAMSDAQIGAMYAMQRRLGKSWLRNFLDDDWLELNYGGEDDDGKKINAMKQFAAEMGQPQSTLAALRRRLERFTRFDFIVKKPADDSIKRIMDYLLAGKNVVLEFG